MFKLVYLDAKPMVLRGKSVLAGLAMTRGGPIAPGRYYGLFSRRVICLLSAAGKVFSEKQREGVVAPVLPVTIDADRSSDIDVQDIYTDEPDAYGLDVTLNHVGFDLPEDEWVPVTINDSAGENGEGWVRLENGKVRLQAASGAIRPLTLPFKIARTNLAC